MPITSIVKGNLIDLAKEGKYGAIAHCANCFCVMGAGIAPQIAKAFPQAEIADNNTVKGDRKKLGTFSVGYNPEHDVWVYNLYGQYSPRSKETDIAVNYRAIADSFKILNNYWAKVDGVIGIPQLGSGLAGGHWDAIETIINLVTPDIELELVIYE